MQNLYRTAAVVTVFSTFEHFLGFLYRIILSRVLGSEGLGVYQSALSVFAVFLTVCSSGLPITLSRAISKHRAKGSQRGERSATSAAVLITLLFSVPTTVLLFLLRKPFSSVFSDSRQADLFYIFLTGLSITSVYAVIRGSFWGNKRFFAYSLIELIEEIVMIGVGVLLLLAFHDGVSKINKAGISVIISYICSFSIALIYYFAKGGRFSSPKREFLPLLKSSLPVTAMRTSSSMMGSLISVIFPMRLVAFGVSPAKAMSEYGVVYGMVMPILMMPCTLISSIALVLVPELAECFFKQQKEKVNRLVGRALCSALVVATTLIPLFFVCGECVGIFLYSNAESGKMIAYCAPVLLPISITMITTSLLNSMNCEKQTLAFFLVGSAAMLGCVWFLPRYLGSGALLLGVALDFSLTALCSLVLLYKKVGNLHLKGFCLKCLLAVTLTTVIGYFTQMLFMRVFSYVLATCITLVLLALIEAVLLQTLKLFDFRTVFARFFVKKAKKVSSRS